MPTAISSNRPTCGNGISNQWASDYPHPDHPGDYLEELRGMVAGMTTNARRGVLGENVARAYKLA